ncbi:MAG: adenylate kinase [Deltaproteobacteria bacterium]|nr:adenylate kinase [Deltaproteobacteria bacterium]
MNILIFGPNGSGKGTQGAILQKQFQIPHIESGVIFRENISKGTELGKKAKGYIDRGELVPDNITIPMILDRLQQPDGKKGWLLDGFPRNVIQAKELDDALMKAHLELDYVIEIVLDRQIAKNRIMGRRLCVKDNNHPNNIFIEAIKPAAKEGKMICRVCGAELTSRADDQDETAIDKRHGIYYNPQEGTLAAVYYFKQKGKKSGARVRVIELDGRPGVKEVSEDLMKKIGAKK